ncbi:MAG TPA: universal stress protein [Gammaproteobacteria bacterium]|nr:universal stress protein [Gammaproteobacteria bacterium]
MANNKRVVLVAVDPTASAHPSIERAAWLARHEPAHIELFISDYTPQLAQSRAGWTVDEARASVIDRHRRRLEQLAEPLRAEKLAVDIDARWDYPLHDSIVRKAQDAGADLVIKDTHYHSVLKRSIFSNTDWSLIRNCGATLWLVKPRPPGQRPCLVAAVDPLHQRDKPAGLDHRILTTARAFSDSLNGELHAFHAFDVAAAIAVSTDAMSMPIALPLNELADAMRAEHTDAVARLCKEHDVPPERTHVHQGGTRQLLLALTEQLRADAVVMGAVSRSGLKGLFLGNTAEDVLDRLHCDLVIVKPDGFKAVLPG